MDELDELSVEHDLPSEKKEGSSHTALIIIIVLFISAIAVVGLVGLVMWQLGVFTTTGGHVMAQGFTRLKPQLAGTGYESDGTFTTIFTNGVGTRINVSADGIVFEHSSGRCGPARLDGGTSFGAGMNFRITADGCPILSRGDVYEVEVSIPYTVTIGDVTSDHVEEGLIRGPAE